MERQRKLASDDAAAAGELRCGIAAAPDGRRYAAGLFGLSWFAWLVWLALLLFTPASPDPLRLWIWSWFAPLPYAFAWAVLTVASAREAGIALLALALTNAGLASAGLVAGIFSGGILGLPAFLVCGALFGQVAGALHREVAPRLSEDWRWIHRRGGAAAGAGLAAAMLIGGIDAQHWPSQILRFTVLGAVLSIGFAWHARVSWWQLREDEWQCRSEERERAAEQQGLHAGSV
ncbi:hypothetical protein GWK16_06690 [Roseomonas sp. JC162]|uniref:Uncharacterized protein n=1 Tax=Neoroseomonas marina TaxID=1232220 RepID=A0A848EBS4_9PROT|nr:hypothetical protein [Neoroseomonas marina]NMJ40920.1 hypothetical protein [Neoroseomonas marina]